MLFFIDDFENFVNPVILERGHFYFENGYVGEVNEVEPELYEATVDGTERYEVLIIAEDDMVEECSCTCPYDHGPICKHIVAVLYKLQQQELEYFGFRKKSTPASSNNAVPDDTDKLLSKLSHEELKRYVKELVTKNQVEKDIFFATYAHLDGDDTKENYRKHVDSILRAALNNKGYLSWEKVDKMDQDLDQLLKVAEKHHNEQRFLSLFYICSAILEGLLHNIYLDELFETEFIDVFNSTLEFLFEIPIDKIDKSLQKAIFDFSVKAFEDERYIYLDWHSDMLKLASCYIGTEKEYDELMQLIEQHKSSDLDKENILIIQYNTISRFEGVEAADLFLKKNISYPAVRRLVILNAIKNRDLNLAKEIALGGVEQDKELLPMQCMEWYGFLLNIAKENDDKGDIIKYARLLYGKKGFPEQEYYNFLQNDIRKEDWDE